MTKTTLEKRAARSGYWREQISEQQRNRMSVHRFCRERGLTEQSFYLWRKRLQKQSAVQFALVETGSAQQPRARESDLELVLATGERLRIGVDVDPSLLRRVVEALRG